MKITIRIALLVVLCISLLFFLSYKEGVTTCGTCYNHTNLWQDYCHDNNMCWYTFYYDQRACCDPGDPSPPATCNTSLGDVVRDKFWLNPYRTCIYPHTDSCINWLGCSQNPTWSYTSFDNCLLLTPKVETYVTQYKLCN